MRGRTTTATTLGFAARTLLRPSTDAVARIDVHRLLTLSYLYLGIRAAGVGLLVGMQLLNHRRPTLQAWDTYWYGAIAQYGYAGVPVTMTDAFGHHTADTSLVFFPGYPLLVHLVALTGMRVAVAAVGVSVVAGLIAAFAVAQLARRLTLSARVEWITVVLFAAAPMSIVYSMGYPEALLMALAAWALVAMLDHRWWLVAPLVTVAGSVSPMAAPLIAVAVVACFVDVYRGRVSWPGVAALAVMPMGMVGYLSWVQAHAGLGSYFAVQRASWGSGFDVGWSTARWVFTTLTKNGGLFTVGTALIAVAAVVGTALAVRWRWPWQVCGYCAGVVLLAWGTDSLLWDKARLLLAAFPLLVLMAGWLARGSRTAVVAGTALVALGGLWFSAESLAVWQYSI